MKPIADRIAELQAAEPEITRKKLVAYLTIDDYAVKDIAEALPAEKRTDFRTDYYNMLVETVPTDEAAKEWIESYDGLTDNQRKHIPAFLRDADLVRRVAEKFKPVEEPKPEDEEKPEDQE